MAILSIIFETSKLFGEKQKKADSCVPSALRVIE